jgi:hypothetical protein
MEIALIIKLVATLVLGILIPSPIDRRRRKDCDQ